MDIDARRVAPSQAFRSTAPVSDHAQRSGQMGSRPSMPRPAAGNRKALGAAPTGKMLAVKRTAPETASGIESPGLRLVSDGWVFRNSDSFAVTQAIPGT